MRLHFRRRFRKASLFVVCATVTSLFGVEACLDSAIALRFREAYAPGFVDGASQALANPDTPEDGIRTAFAALFEGLGAIIQPRAEGSSNAQSNRR
jgi:hypothetical protein